MSVIPFFASIFINEKKEILHLMIGLAWEAQFTNKEQVLTVLRDTLYLVYIFYFPLLFSVFHPQISLFECLRFQIQIVFLPNCRKGDLWKKSLNARFPIGLRGLSGWTLFITWTILYFGRLPLLNSHWTHIISLSLWTPVNVFGKSE